MVKVAVYHYTRLGVYVYTTAMHYHLAAYVVFSHAYCLGNVGVWMCDRLDCNYILFSK